MSPFLSRFRSWFGSSKRPTLSIESDPWDYADGIVANTDLYDDCSLKPGFTQLSARDRTVVAIHLCQAEWNNGGLHQFFFNSAGILGPEALQAHEAIGMPIVCKLLKEGMGMLGNDYPRDWDQRRKMLEAVDEDALDQLDQKFFKVNREENGGIDVALRKYFLRSEP